MVKLKYYLKKTIDIKTSYVVVLIITLLLFVVGCFSYAVFTSTSEAKGALNIVTGNLYALIESVDLDENKSVTLTPGEEKIVTLNLINTNGRNAKLNLFYSSTSNNVEIGYLASGDAAPGVSGYVLGKNGSDSDTKKIYVKIVNKDSVNVTVTFGSNAGLDNAELAFPNDKNVINYLSKCDNITTFCIDKAEDLINLANEVNSGDNKIGKTYYLTSDLDLGGKFDENGVMLEGSTNWVSIGNSSSTAFGGIFDGQGHIIRNLYINNDLEDGNQGLFGIVSAGGVIKNFGIEDSYLITANSAGMVVDYLYGTLDNVYNKGTVKGGKSSAGLVSVSEGVIKNSYNLGKITSNNQFAGGIVGYEINQNITNVYNVGVITGDSSSGGIVGGLTGNVKNVYNFGPVNATHGAGGIVGQLYRGSISDTHNSGVITNGGGVVGYKDQGEVLENNFYLNSTANFGVYSSSSNENTLPLLDGEMIGVLSVINGDNAFVEDSNNINGGYPLLKWQVEKVFE